MHRLVKLIEGMHASDLDDLVLPLISVDEYESKVSNNAVVLGFYVQDKNAANDLNRFIQKSAISLLDTDISPAPDQHGFFLVFLEMMVNDRLGENVASILDEISTLANIDEWKIRVRKTEGLLPFSPKNLENALEKARRPTKDPVLEFLSKSDVNRVSLQDDNHLQLETYTGKTTYEILGFGNLLENLTKLGLTNVGAACSLVETIRTTRLETSLGVDWRVTQLNGGNFILQRGNSHNALILRHSFS